MIRPVFAALLFLAGASALAAQETLVAIGNVNSAGTLDTSASPLGALVGSVRLADGHYEISVTGAGAFTGAATSDFIVQTTIEASTSGDTISNGTVTAVNADELTVRVRTSDVETLSTPSAAVPKNASFFFVIRRVDPLATVSEGDTRFLIAAGKMGAGGNLLRSFGLNGILTSSLKGDSGEYTLTLTKAGAFASDSTADYVLLLSPLAGAATDETVRGDVVNVASDDSAGFFIRTDDVQSQAGSDSPVPTNRGFTYAIFRTNGVDATGAPASRINAALVSVASNGNLVFGQSTLPGATVVSSRTGTGRYLVDLVAPNQFAPSDIDRYSPLASIRASNTIDENITAEVSVPDANTLRITISVDDVQDQGSAGGVALTDQAFFISLLDLAPPVLHDLSLSSRDVSATFRGAGILNKSGAGQTVLVRLKGTTPSRVFFRSENAGDAADSLRIRGQAILGHLDSHFFLTTTGRRNITAEVKIGAVASEDVRPGQVEKFEGRVRYKKTNKTPNIISKFRTLPGSGPADADLVRVQLKPR